MRRVTILNDPKFCKPSGGLEIRALSFEDGYDVIFSETERKERSDLYCLKVGGSETIRREREGAASEITQIIGKPGRGQELRISVGFI